MERQPQKRGFENLEVFKFDSPRARSVAPKEFLRKGASLRKFVHKQVKQVDNERQLTGNQVKVSSSKKSEIQLNCIKTNPPLPNREFLNYVTDRVSRSSVKRRLKGFNNQILKDQEKFEKPQNVTIPDQRTQEQESKQLSFKKSSFQNERHTIGKTQPAESKQIQEELRKLEVDIEEFKDWRKSRRGELEQVKKLWRQKMRQYDQDNRIYQAAVMNNDPNEAKWKKMADRLKEIRDCTFHFCNLWKQRIKQLETSLKDLDTKIQSKEKQCKQLKKSLKRSLLKQQRQQTQQLEVKPERQSSGKCASNYKKKVNEKVKKKRQQAEEIQAQLQEI